MPFNLTDSQPLFFVVWVAAILIALSGHEFAHALMSSRLGDDTARLMGRLTLNPLAHIDPIGFFALILVGFGWGKPVPFDPTRLSSVKFGPGLVGIAGPLANLVMALITGAALKLILTFTDFSAQNLLVIFLMFLLQLNLILMIFNLIPLPPLDGSKLFFSLLPSSLRGVEIFLEKFGPFILIFLIIFDNQLPVPILGTIFRSILSAVYSLF